MVLRALGQDAIAPKAENILIPDFILTELSKHYKHIVMLLDADSAGVKGASKYPYPSIWLPILKYNENNTLKDVADYVKVFGIDYTKTLLFNLLTNKN